MVVAGMECQLAHDGQPVEFFAVLNTSGRSNSVTHRPVIRSVNAEGPWPYRDGPLVVMMLVRHLNSPFMPTVDWPVVGSLASVSQSCAAKVLVYARWNR